MRHAMGVAVFAGMIGVTIFGIFLTPVFYVVLRALTGNRSLKQHGQGKGSASAIEEQFTDTNAI
jgi:multidrug efflux pump